MNRNIFWKDPLILYCKGGGSSSGGSSGKVDYPDYMKTFHGKILNNDGGDVPTYSVVDAINSAYGNSPFAGESAYDPSTPISDMITAVAAFNAAVDALDYDGDWEAAIDTAQGKIDSVIVDDTTINAEVAAFDDNKDDERDTQILPRYKAGMLNVNAVMTSSFTIGEAVIEAFGARDSAKFEADLRIKAHMQRNDMIIQGAHEMLKDLLQRVLFEKDVAHYTIESNRIKIVANKERDDRQLWIDEKDALWDLETFQYGANMLASIGGGTATHGAKDISGGSRLGGALSGAAAGAMIGAQTKTPHGVAIGAIIGGIGGYLA